MLPCWRFFFCYRSCSDKLVYNSCCCWMKRKMTTAAAAEATTAETTGVLARLRTATSSSDFSGQNLHQPHCSCCAYAGDIAISTAKLLTFTSCATPDDSSCNACCGSQEAYTFPHNPVYGLKKLLKNQGCLQKGQGTHRRLGAERRCVRCKHEPCAVADEGAQQAPRPTRELCTVTKPECLDWRRMVLDSPDRFGPCDGQGGTWFRRIARTDSGNNQYLLHCGSQKLQQ